MRQWYSGGLENRFPHGFLSSILSLGVSFVLYSNFYKLYLIDYFMQKRFYSVSNQRYYSCLYQLQQLPQLYVAQRFLKELNWFNDQRISGASLPSPKTHALEMLLAQSEHFLSGISKTEFTKAA